MIGQFGQTTTPASSADRSGVRPAARTGSPPRGDPDVDHSLAAGPSTAVRLRRLTAGSALILFPALLVAEAPLDPTGNGSGADLYAAATEHRGALVTSAVLLIVSGVLMAPAAAGILHQARDRGAALANAGAVLAVLGGFGHFGIAMFYLVGTSLPGGAPTRWRPSSTGSTSARRSVSWPFR